MKFRKLLFLRKLPIYPPVLYLAVEKPLAFVQKKKRIVSVFISLFFADI